MARPSVNTDTTAPNAAVVVITGCSSGFGLAAALAFARAGDRVYATIRNTAKAEAVKAAATSHRLPLTIRELDVTSDESVTRAIGGVLENEGRIDVLVNNAGVARVGPVEQLPDRLVRETFETNFFGPLRTIRAVLPAMRECRSGAIVNVSSVAGRTWGKPITWAYDASKHSLGTLSDGLALELEPFGIRVRVIEPGFFATKMLENSLRCDEPDSPYWGLEQDMWDYFDRSVEDAPGPQQVADAVVQAAKAPAASPVHILVGDDARGVASAFGSTSEQAWINRIKQTLKL